MKGKTVLVTGATDGIGKATALALGTLGAHVILHGRSAQRLSLAAGEIHAATGSSADTLQADFSSLAAVRMCAEQILREFPRLDALVHNAGIFARHREVTPDGYESTLAINHLAPFLLTHLLEGFLRQSSPARIVVVSSITHVQSTLDFENLQGEKRYDGREAYSLSKLANAMFTVELAERLRGSGVTVNCFHPGVIATKLLRSGYGNMAAASPDRGAEQAVYLVASPDVEGVTGKYFVNGREARPSPLVHDASLRARLWRVSEQLCGIS